MSGSSKILNKYLQVAGNRIGRKLLLGENGLCVFKSPDLQQEYVVEFPKHSDVIYFYAPICRVPYDCSEEFFEKILELNICGIEYNQATFGLDAKTQNVVLSYTRALGSVDDVSFANILCNFVRTADRAKREVMKLVDALAEKYSLAGDDVAAEMDKYSAKIKLDKMKA
ncbi:MAG: CesT family type III secretion system chaperone [Puniceicoccales bacterium]|jgi:hypothetical protein|nr:CesT family type III secretion system chaperone [Puniceicoccales bacterium]